MRFDHLKSFFISAAVFIILFAGGSALSKHKLLWNDELYSQETSVSVDSYAGLLTLKIPDGNKNPLFYVIQKGVCDIFSFHLPAIPPSEQNKVRELRSQIIMRIPSDAYMSLALALIFYFFTRFYSVYAALYALGTALVTPMVWMYWVEARPYPLWFLLTTIQLLLLVFEVRFSRAKRVKSIFLVHLLLAFTTPASMFQITIASVFLWWKARYRFKQAALIWVLPIVVAVFYYFADYISTIRTYMFMTNLFDVVMPERLFVYIIYALVAWVLPQKYKKTAGNIFFLPVFFLFLACGAAVLFFDAFNFYSQQGFYSRYLIYIAPADILMFSLASIDLRQWSRQNPWICMNVSILLGGLVIIRGLMTYRDILGAALYLPLS